ncbi:MAG: GntR family transcriptional regulator [Burkholderiales bacterium]|nr:GntR family transcriptional regulator [Burkholderiales bacterium]MDE2396684.1 GntR family transcriptional regulator [Burkholderiales bacterium]MDE2456236.1 GntR family transcriptional regulator [Burkholderiales bacterium]
MPTPASPLAGLELDAAASTPLYLQVRNGLSRLIRDGRFGPEDALPSERSLAETLSISRVTARKAIDALVGDGLIVRRHGSGNYIAPLLEQPLTRLTSFTEELKQRGFVPSSRWLRRTVGAALPDEMVALGLAPGARVARLERVRLADTTPMAYESSALPTTVLPNPEAVSESLYAFLAASESAPARALQHIRATNATLRQAELLGIPVGQALLFITRVGYADDGRAVEITHTWCRSDYYDFVAELRR